MTAPTVSEPLSLASEAYHFVVSSLKLALGRIDGHTYVVLQPATWSAARDTAANMGGYLAAIADQAENDWIVANVLTFLQVAWRLVFGKIAPALVRAFRQWVRADQDRLKIDVPAPVLCFGKTHYRASCNQSMVQYPVEGTTHHLFMTLWQIARRKPDLAPVLVPACEIIPAFRAKGDLGHV